jgi:hypothetical protein
MSDVHRRRFTLPLLVVVLLFAGTCKSPPQPPVKPLIPEHDCARGPGLNRREKPVICVDNVSASLSVDPDRIVAWDKAPDQTHNMLHWVTRTKSGNLEIRFKDAGCVETPVDCDGKGRCKAKTLEVASTKTCKYDVIVDGRVLDPQAVIVKCCGMTEEEPPQ